MVINFIYENLESRRREITTKNIEPSVLNFLTYGFKLNGERYHATSFDFDLDGPCINVTIEKE